MNENINLREVLKDTPKGTLLYSPLIGEVEFDQINILDKLPIHIRDKKGNKYNFTQQGTYFPSMGECLLFPSKDQRDWSKYQRPFVNGDIITSKEGGIALFSHTQTRFDCSNVVYYHCLFYPSQTFKLGLNYGIGCVSDCRLATEEEKQKLFQVFKDRGYKWNDKIKRLEALVTPNFKAGDIIWDKNYYKVKITNVNIEDSFYIYESLIAKGIGTITFNDQYDWELVTYKVGDHFINPNNNSVFVITEIQNNGNYSVESLGKIYYPFEMKKLDVDKCTKINKWDPKWLKPFDEVLVRDIHRECWVATLFSHIIDSDGYPYLTSRTNSKYCIPYNNETQHLVGTTLEEPEFYKL